MVPSKKRRNTHLSLVFAEYKLSDNINNILLLNWTSKDLNQPKKLKIPMHEVPRNNVQKCIHVTAFNLLRALLCKQYLWRLLINLSCATELQIIL